MKMTKVVVAVVAMCAMFATEVNAQTSSPKNEQKSAVLKITRSAKQVTMVTSKDTVTAVRTRVCDVSDSVKLERYEARRAGKTPETVYFDGHNKDIEGKLLSRPFIELGAGATYAFSSKEVRPVFRLTAGWEMRYLLMFADFEFGTKGFSTSDALTDNGIREGSEAVGRYNTFTGVLNGALKVWNSSDFNSFIAVFGGAGYSYAKTDGDDESIRFSSSFYQLRWQAGLLAKYGFNSHWGLTGRLYIQNPSNNEHDSAQDAGKLAVGAQVGVNYSF